MRIILLSKTKFVGTIVSMLLVGFWLGLNYNQTFGYIAEDQSLVCDLNYECLIIDNDDFFNDEQLDTLNTALNYDLDTFSIGDID